jgi:Chaperone of endosialidase
MIKAFVTTRLAAAVLFFAPAALAQAQVGSAFTYQGRLDSGGAPYTGSADIQFSLWDSAAGGTQIRTTQTATGLAVTNGLFTRSLDFGLLCFDGGAVWLQLAVRAPGGAGAFTTLTPRQAMTPTPYASSLAPPVQVLSSNSSYDALAVVQSGGAFSAGVFAITDTNSIAAALRSEHRGNGPAVAGLHSPTGNYGWAGTSAQGVLGSSPSVNGVLGRTAAGSGPSAGVYGLSTGLNGNGVAGQADNGTDAWGVWGGSVGGVGVSAVTTTGIGVLATSDSGDAVKATSNSYDGIDGATSGAGKSGVYGHTDNAEGFGVSGWNWVASTNGALGTQTAGVSGYAYPATGVNYGVFGSTGSPAGYGGYFVGRGYFSDNVGIGVQQPSVPLVVAGGTDASLSGGGNVIIGQSGSANLVFDNNEIMARNNGVAANLFLNALGGNVGIGTNAPQGFTLAVAGTAAKTNGGSWSTLSDARMKKNIRDLPPGSLDKVLSLRARTFEYLPEAVRGGLVTPGEHVGLVAQDVEKVLPEWVETNPEGTKFISEKGTTALLVEALRELRAEKDKQLADLRAQRDRELAQRDATIAELSRRLGAVEERLGTSGHVAGRPAGR